MNLAHEFEERLVQVAGHAIGKVLECYKRHRLNPKQVRRMKILEEAARAIEVLNLMGKDMYLE